MGVYYLGGLKMFTKMFNRCIAIVHDTASRKEIGVLCTKDFNTFKVTPIEDAIKRGGRLAANLYTEGNTLRCKETKDNDIKWLPHIINMPNQTEFTAEYWNKMAISRSPYVTSPWYGIAVAKFSVPREVVDKDMFIVFNVAKMQLQSWRARDIYHQLNNKSVNVVSNLYADGKGQSMTFKPFAAEFCTNLGIPEWSATMTMTGQVVIPYQKAGIDFNSTPKDKRAAVNEYILKNPFSYGDLKKSNLKFGKITLSNVSALVQFEYRDILSVKTVYDLRAIDLLYAQFSSMDFGNFHTVEQSEMSIPTVGLFIKK